MSNKQHESILDYFPAGSGLILFGQAREIDVTQDPEDAKEHGIPVRTNKKPGKLTQLTNDFVNNFATAFGIRQ